MTRDEAKTKIEAAIKRRAADIVDMYLEDHELRAQIADLIERAQRQAVDDALISFCIAPLGEVP